MNEHHQTNNNDEQLAQSPLKLPRETNKDINTSPVKQQVNRNQIIGRPIEIIKGKLLENIVLLHNQIIGAPNHIDIFEIYWSLNEIYIFINHEGRTPSDLLEGYINIFTETFDSKKLSTMRAE